MESPWRTDIPGKGPFVGRAAELDVLVDAVRCRRGAIAAIMGGRGMGKTTFALRLKALIEAERLGEVLLLRQLGVTLEDAAHRVGAMMGVALDLRDVAGSIEAALLPRQTTCTVLLLDEADGLLNDTGGQLFFEQLRIAYEALEGRLAVFVLGGSLLKQLAISNASPFLRSARWVLLRGLALDETGRLLREPLGLEIDDTTVKTLHSHTGGHPLLLQGTMERAAMAGEPVAAKILTVFKELVRDEQVPRLFPLWWANLTEPGQRMYLRLLEQRRPVPYAERLAVFGDRPGDWIEVLETTGVAQLDTERALLPRNEVFRRWVHLTIQLPAPSTAHPSEEPEPLRHTGSEFERGVVSAVMRWATGMRAYASFGLSEDASQKGNKRLQPEQHFQLSLLLALQQHELEVDAEAWSQLGRSDLKIRDRALTACAWVEAKIWGRSHEEVVKQLMGYARPEDAFGFVVMVDRQDKPLAPNYAKVVLKDFPGEGDAWLFEAKDLKRFVGVVPFVTTHARPQGAPLRIYHVLLQLPSDKLLRRQPSTT